VGDQPVSRRRRQRNLFFGEISAAGRTPISCAVTRSAASPPVPAPAVQVELRLDQGALYQAKRPQQGDKQRLLGNPHRARRCDQAQPFATAGPAGPPPGGRSLDDALSACCRPRSFHPGSGAGRLGKRQFCRGQHAGFRGSLDSSSNAPPTCCEGCRLVAQRCTSGRGRFRRSESASPHLTHPLPRAGTAACARQRSRSWRDNRRAVNRASSRGAELCS